MLGLHLYLVNVKLQFSFFQSYFPHFVLQVVHGDVGVAIFGDYGLPCLNLLIYLILEEHSYYFHLLFSILFCVSALKPHSSL